MLLHLLGLSDFADASSSVNYADLVDASSFGGTVALQTLVHLSKHRDVVTLVHVVDITALLTLV